MVPDRIAADYPFPYIGHGVLALEGVTKAADAYLALRSPITRANRAELRDGCPKPIDGFWTWGPTIVSCASLGDVFDFELALAYVNKPPRPDPRDAITKKTVAMFAADVEKWIRAVHAR